MKISINYDDVIESMQQINIISDNINSSFENIRKNCTSLTNGGYWIGPSANNFASKFAELSNSFQEIYGELRSSATYLTYVVNNYKSRDRKIEQQLNNRLLKNRAAVK